MKFTHSLTTTLVVFSLAYLGWLLPQFHSHRPLEKFDEPPPSESAGEKPENPREVPMQVVKVRQSDATSVPAQSKPDAIVLQPKDQPSPPSRKQTKQKAPTRRGTYGFALK